MPSLCDVKDDDIKILMQMADYSKDDDIKD